MLNLAFLCTSLEPGRDGVGDYTWQLTAELIRQGHQVGIVALNDKSLITEWRGVQTVDTIDIPVLRVPAVWSSKQRFDRAKEWIDVMQPDWLSLQYVPFGFHDKGLPIGLTHQLAELGRGCRWHIMFHELWVGMDVAATPKHRVWGWVQRQIVRQLLGRLRPAAIHTQSSLYKAQLSRLGYSVKLLPLFSNIPVYPQEVAKTKNPATVRLVTFGTLHPNAPVESFAHEMADYSRISQQSMFLTLAGRMGAEQQRWHTAWKNTGMPIDVVGELPTEAISVLLSESDLGISTTVVAMIEKSSAVATMRGHGLPVLCVANPWQSREVSNPALPSGVVAYEPGNLAKCLSGELTVGWVPTLTETVRTLLTDLHNR